MIRRGVAVSVAFVLAVGLLLPLRPFVLAAYHVQVAGRILASTRGMDAAMPLDPGNIQADLLPSADLSPVFAHLEAALENDDQFAQAWRLLGRAAARSGDYDRALSAFAECAKLRPGDPLIPVEKAAVHRTLLSSEPAQATQGLRQDWRDANISAHDLLLRGEEDRLAGEAGGALFWFDQALALDPTSGEAWFRTGQVHATEQDWLQAMEAFRKAERFLPNDGQVQFELGWALYKQAGDPTVAEPYLRRAVDLLPDDMWPTLRLAALLRADGRLAEALTLVRGAERAFPNDPWPLIYEGRILLELGEPDAALAPLQRATALAPPEAEAFYLLGQAATRQGRWEATIRDTQQAIALQPARDYYYVALGQAFRATGKVAEARGAFQQALRFNPQNVAAQQALAEIEGSAP